MTPAFLSQPFCNHPTSQWNHRTAGSHTWSYLRQNASLVPHAKFPIFAFQLYIPPVTDSWSLIWVVLAHRPPALRSNVGPGVRPCSLWPYKDNFSSLVSCAILSLFWVWNNDIAWKTCHEWSWKRYGKTLSWFTLWYRGTEQLVLVVLLLLEIHCVSQNRMFLINISHGWYCNKSVFKWVTSRGHLHLSFEKFRKLFAGKHSYILEVKVNVNFYLHFQLKHYIKWEHGPDCMRYF